jgi:hypothetical protein
MKKTSLTIAAVAVGFATPAIAHDTTTAFPTRGACEAASAAMSNDENGWLVATFPEFFDTIGEASSFLARAWTCDRNSSDGQYYITDHVEDVLASDWYARRNR